MRRFIAAAVITAALATLAVMADHAQADDGPSQATATRRFISTDTPGPSPTQGPPTATWVTSTPVVLCPPLDTYCRKAYLPVMRRDPRPTAIPTATDEPEVVCRELLYNGSFEDGITGWQEAFPPSIPRWTVGETSDAPHGSRALSLSPFDSETIFLRSRAIHGPFGPAVTKATFAYSWKEFTNDWLRNSDALFFSVFGTRLSVYDESFGNDQERPRAWRRVTADVTDRIKAATVPLLVGIDAMNDVSRTTRWAVDAVSLEICAWE